MMLAFYMMKYSNCRLALRQSFSNRKCEYLASRLIGWWGPVKKLVKKLDYLYLEKLLLGGFRERSDVQPESRTTTLEFNHKLNLTTKHCGSIEGRRSGVSRPLSNQITIMISKGTTCMK